MRLWFEYTDPDHQYQYTFVITDNYLGEGGPLDLHVNIERDSLILTSTIDFDPKDGIKWIEALDHVISFKARNYIERIIKNLSLA